ncbi:MAG: hypothetical protein ACI936_003217 [Paraglaciecola sp.]|jgi:hypothetical protein
MQIPEGLELTEIKTSTNKLNVILVGDTNMLADRFWVQKSNFFSQTISTPLLTMEILLQMQLKTWVEAMP